MSIDESEAFGVEVFGISLRDNDNNTVGYFTTVSGDPTGTSAPVNTYAFRQDNYTLWYKHNTGDNDWRQLRAADVAFDNTGLKFVSTHVYDALVELRNRDVHSVLTTTVTLNGTLTLDDESEEINTLHGTATGYSVVLPDATTLFKGRRFEVDNNTTQTVLAKDDGGTTLATLIEGDIALFTLEDNATSDGSWVISVTSSAATGITSYSVGSTTAFVTSSTTDVIITGMTTTPVSGRYALLYSADAELSQNNAVAQVVIFQDGTAIARTRRNIQGVGSNFATSASTIAEVSVDGTEAIDVRVNVSTGDFTTNSRRLILIRLGPQ